MNNLLLKTYFISGARFKECVEIEKLNGENTKYLLENNPYFINLIKDYENVGYKELREMSFNGLLKTSSCYLELFKDRIEDDFKKIPRTIKHLSFNL